MTIYSLWDIHSLNIVLVSFLIKGVSMSGVSRGGNSYNKLWDIKKENREIFVLYNFLELDELSFVDIFTNKYEYIDSISKNQNHHTDTMILQLQNACLDFAHHIETKIVNHNKNIHQFAYKKILFNLNYKDCLLSSTVFDVYCAKKYLLQIYNYISLSDEILSSLTINNVRLVNFAWSFLRLATDYRNNRNLSINHIDTGTEIVQGREHKYIYNNLNLIQMPFDTKIKIEQIKKFFDLLSIGRNEKEIEIQRIYDKWNNVKNDLRVTKWLSDLEGKKSGLSDENKKEMISWIWRHIKTKYYNGITPIWGGIDNNYSTNSIQQQQENIITFFDLMTNEAIKSSIISELKTSASKAKHKILNNKKTHLNTPISEKTKSKFDALKKHFNFSNEEMIISLIDDGYEKIKLS